MPSSDKLEADYANLLRKVELQTASDIEKVKAELLALKTQAETSPASG